VESMRILVATEPRSYREVMVHTVKELRPHVEVIAIEPDRLDDEITRSGADIVFCSHLTTAVIVRSSAWIVLYPEGQRLTVTGIEGCYTTTTDLDLEQILAVVDRTEVLVDAGKFC